MSTTLVPTQEALYHVFALVLGNLHTQLDARITAVHTGRCAAHLMPDDDCSECYDFTIARQAATQHGERAALEMLALVITTRVVTEVNDIRAPGLEDALWDIATAETSSESPVDDLFHHMLLFFEGREIAWLRMPVLTS